MQEPSRSAFITVVQRPKPNHASKPSNIDLGVARAVANTRQIDDGIVEYDLEIVNRGIAAAENTFITMPFDPTEVRVLDAAFSRPTAFVDHLTANSLEMHTGPLAANGDVVTATVRLLTRPAAAMGAMLGERLSYSWNDSLDGGSGHSNLPILVAAERDLDQALYPLTIIPATAPTEDRYTFRSQIFKPDEPVSFWYQASDGRNVGVATAITAGDGTAGIEFAVSDLSSGDYIMVAYGEWTSFTAVGSFVVR